MEYQKPIARYVKINRDNGEGAVVEVYRDSSNAIERLFPEDFSSLSPWNLVETSEEWILAYRIGLMAEKTKNNQGGSKDVFFYFYAGLGKIKELVDEDIGEVERRVNEIILGAVERLGDEAKNFVFITSYPPQWMLRELEEALKQE